MTYRGGRTRAWTDEQGLELLRMWAQQFGRVPKTVELIGPTQNWFTRRFGSYGEACERAGLPRPKIGRRISRAG